MTFGEALEIIKQGGKCKRKGWNGKDQYIIIGYGIAYHYHEHPQQAAHSDIGSKAIVFCETKGEQVGWTASQADILAEDWVEV